MLNFVILFRFFYLPQITTLKSKIAADDTFIVFFFFFFYFSLSKKIRLDVSHEISSLIFPENNAKYNRLSSAAVVIGALEVAYLLQNNTDK